MIFYDALDVCLCSSGKLPCGVLLNIKMQSSTLWNILLFGYFFLTVLFWRVGLLEVQCNMINFELEFELKNIIGK
jgi:hypothetical protein